MDPERGEATFAPALKESLLNEEKTTHRYPGSLYRHMYDANAKDISSGYSLGFREIGIPLLQAAACEFIGTFLLEFFGIFINTGVSCIWFILFNSCSSCIIFLLDYLFRTHIWRPLQSIDYMCYNG